MGIEFEVFPKFNTCLAVFQNSLEFVVFEESNLSKLSKWELGSNYLLISRDFKNCMVIRAIYFKVFALANR